MSNPRNYRPSQLNSSSVITPPGADAPETSVEATQEPSTTPQAPQKQSRAEKSAQWPTTAKKAKPKRERRVYYMDPDEHARAEAAYAFTAGHTRLRSWTAFVEAAIQEKTRSLEAKYNDARPFTELED